MSSMLEWFVLVNFLCYCGFLFWFYRGLRKTVFSKSDSIPGKISVIVAARDEAANLPHLLDSLSRQDFPSSHFEIIVVNDHSSDETGLVLEEWKQKIPNLVVVDSDKAVSSGLSGKKRALHAGIQNSRYEFLLFTDADCRPPKTWIAQMAGLFAAGADLVVGGAPLQFSVNPPPRWQRMAVLESWMIQFTNHAAIQNNFPLSCTGRNLGYTKELFNRIGGFEAIASSLSGDDDLLLQQAAGNKSFTIQSTIDRKAVVYSPLPTTLNDYIPPKQRHHSTGKYLPPGKMIFFGAWHGSNLLFTIAFILIAIDLISSPLWIVLLLPTKILLELLFFRSAGRAGVANFSFGELVLFFLFYPIVTAIVGCLGLIRRPRWK